MFVLSLEAVLGDFNHRVTFKKILSVPLSHIFNILILSVYLFYLDQFKTNHMKDFV